MAQYTIQFNSQEQENLLQDFLKNLRIHFTKSDEKEENFVFTDEMKRVCDEALKQDRSTYRDADEVMAELDAKYGL